MYVSDSSWVSYTSSSGAKKGANIMREGKEEGGSGRLCPFSISAIWAGVELVNFRGSTILSAHVGAGRSEWIEHNEWRRSSSLVRKAFLESKIWGAGLLRQEQVRHDLVCGQRLPSVKPGSQGPVFIET